MDLNKFRDSFVNPIILKIINSGINGFDADEIAEIEFNKFSYSIFKTWSQFYSIDSVNYHWVMYKIFLNKRKIFEIELTNKYILNGIDRYDAVVKANEEAYDKFLEDINNHIVHLPGNLEPLKSRFSNNKGVYNYKIEDAIDGEEQFFKSHYGGGSDALGY